MKVLFSCNIPFSLAHGGMQIQIEQTQSSLQKVGVDIEPLKWWELSQSADILHHFSALPPYVIQMAQEKKMKVVQSAFLGGLGAKPEWRRKVQKLGRQTVMKVSPKGIRDSLGWDAFRLGDACIAMTEWEAHLLKSMYDVDPRRLHVIPNGVEEVFLEPSKSTRGESLVCTSTIVELKQVLKLAQAAVLAKTPLWVIGRPFSPNDAYALQFQKFARENSKIVRYEGPISSRPQLAEIYRNARGFVLLSKWESLSLSALEAAACGCPLLLSDLPWAKTAFGPAVSYCGINASLDETAKALRAFYDSAPKLDVPPKPLSWLGVAQKLKAVYEGLISGPAAS